MRGAGQVRTQAPLSEDRGNPVRALLAAADTDCGRYAASPAAFAMAALGCGGK